MLDSPAFRRWGWWAALVACFVVIVPGAPFRDALGAQIGGVAFLLAVVAVVRQWREARTSPPAPPAAGRS